MLSYTTLSRRLATSRCLLLRSYHKPAAARPETDEYAIPLRPTWSIDALLSSYTRPTISPSTLKRLHELSALHPPEEGTPEHEKLTAELEDLVKLVEAVKTADVRTDSTAGPIPDSRIWADGTGISLQDAARPEDENRGLSGQDLLSFAARTEGKLYVVESDRRTTE